MAQSISIPDEILMNKIYLIRNVKAMLDRDLATLWGKSNTLKRAS